MDIIGKKRLLFVSLLFFLILAFIPNVIAQEALDSILRDGVLPIYEANQKGIDFIIALVLFLGLVKFALLRGGWEEAKPGFKLVWIALSVALAVGLSWAQQKANFTIAGIFSQFVMIVVLVFLLFLIYNLVKGSENKHGLLIVSSLYLVLYNIASIAAPTLFNAIGGTLSTILGLLNIVFLITFIVGILGFIGGFSVPKLKREDAAGAEVPGAIKGAVKGLWGATFGKRQKVRAEAFKENQEVLNALYGSLSGNIRDGEEAKNRLADLSNRILGMPQVTDNVRDTVSKHISELNVHFKEYYDEKIKEDETFLVSLENNLNKEIKTWSGSDLNKVVASIIKQIAPQESKRASSLANRFVGAYKASAITSLQDGIQVISNCKTSLNQINNLSTKLLGHLTDAQYAIRNKDKQVFVLRLKDSITAINNIINNFGFVARSIGEIKDKMKEEAVSDQNLKGKIDEYLSRLFARAN